MFTGIIEEIGMITGFSPIRGGKKITIRADKISDDLKVDHSVSVNGVCLTVVNISGKLFTVEAVGETLDKSTLSDIKKSTFVNLERAMKLGDRLGGHLVQGHVNGMGKISQLVQRGDNWYMEIDLPEELIRYVIPEGSIAIDGISLTVANCIGTKVGISIIPHTFKNTTFSLAKLGQKCNVENDLVGKYLEKWLNYPSNGKNKSPITLDWLQSQGF
jgi:riboflavin synthase